MTGFRTKAGGVAMVALLAAGFLLAPGAARAMTNSDKENPFEQKNQKAPPKPEDPPPTPIEGYGELEWLVDYLWSERPITRYDLLPDPPDPPDPPNPLVFDNPGSPDDVVPIVGDSVSASDIQEVM